MLSQSIGGLRGPVHMGLYYSEILLEVVNHLCSEAASKFAHGNREGSCSYIHTYIAHSLYFMYVNTYICTWFIHTFICSTDLCAKCFLLYSINLHTYIHTYELADVIRSQGCILLSTYLASPVGRLCPFSACILAKATKVPDSLNHILKTGCISSAVRVFKYMRSEFFLLTYVHTYIHTYIRSFEYAFIS